MSLDDEGSSRQCIWELYKKVSWFCSLEDVIIAITGSLQTMYGPSVEGIFKTYEKSLIKIEKKSSVPIVPCLEAKGFYEASPSTSVRCQLLHLPSRPSLVLGSTTLHQSGSCVAKFP
jgi:hypothetical protein